MHGRKKQFSPLTENEINAINEKSKLYTSLLEILIDKRKKQEYNEDNLLFTTKMIVKNPDFFTLWNYRREILISLHGIETNLSLNIPNEKIKNDIIRDQELLISTEGIKKNPKSYGAWYHRQWIAERFDIDITKELELCKLFLKEDQRNFHCWNYRRFIVTLGNIKPDLEYEFSNEKIKENFSNYSAFHHRSVYIVLIIKNNNYNLDIMKDLVNEEIDIITNAIFTEPDDQSSWWYLLFLFKFINNFIYNSNDNSTNTECETAKVWFHDILTNMITTIKELLHEESECTWALKSLINIIDIYKTNNHKIENIKQLLNDRNEYILLLMKIDPVHKNRYNYLLQQ
jgi:geranylgeranyl transferase type-2 subunit alpha